MMNPFQEGQLTADWAVFAADTLFDLREILP
ncbi:hypothetical protein CI610_01265 [invertebrate metagenome]|uniref:Uncharacterized protein n=1 Tax=invertebrate metagenome TaxID=1711999 RepID=A0A2H9T979_9ZZZZ